MDSNSPFIDGTSGYWGARSAAQKWALEETHNNVRPAEDEEPGEVSFTLLSQLTLLITNLPGNFLTITEGKIT